MSATSHTQPMVEDASAPWNPGQTAGDPFAVLDDLMCVIEELCPRWPERPTFEGFGIFLL